MAEKLKNFAFIDSQNVNLAVKDQGWVLDFSRFRKYLQDKYKVEKAYLFIGFLSGNQFLYTYLQKAGYIVIFKPTLIYKDKEGKEQAKGNVDADLVLQAMLDYNEYDKAVIVTSDGDFYSLVKYLYKNGKLRCVISPYIKTCSVLLKKTAREKIVFMDNLRQKLAYKEKHR